MARRPLIEHHLTTPKNEDKYRPTAALMFRLQKFAVLRRGVEGVASIRAEQDIFFPSTPHSARLLQVFARISTLPTTHLNSRKGPIHAPYFPRFPTVIYNFIH